MYSLTMACICLMMHILRALCLMLNMDMEEAGGGGKPEGWFERGRWCSFLVKVDCWC